MPKHGGGSGGSAVLGAWAKNWDELTTSASWGTAGNDGLLYFR
jgi:hypothetical protein